MLGSPRSEPCCAKPSIAIGSGGVVLTGATWKTEVWRSASSPPLDADRAPTSPLSLDDTSELRLSKKVGGRVPRSTDPVRDWTFSVTLINGKLVDDDMPVLEDDVEVKLPGLKDGDELRGGGTAVVSCEIACDNCSKDSRLGGFDRFWRPGSIPVVSDPARGDAPIG